MQAASVYQCNLCNAMYPYYVIGNHVCMYVQTPRLATEGNQARKEFKLCQSIAIRLILDSSNLSNPRPEFDGSLHPVCPEIFRTRLILRQGPTSQVACGAPELFRATAATRKLPKPAQPWDRSHGKMWESLGNHNPHILI